jgi:DNA modification methylase
MAEPYWASEDGDVVVHLGDCLDVLPELPASSIDAIVCDPPYGLAELSAAVVLKAIAAWMAGDRAHVPDGRGFMGREWDAFVPPPGAWDECMRVLKPGGHLLAFAGSRTVDLMTLSIRIAGFEIRDGMAWLYGQGYPKSLDVGKAIDKAGGNPLAFREFARAYAAAVAASVLTHADIDRHLGIKASSCFWTREDHRGGMPPRHHWSKVCELLSLPAELESLYEAAEREVVGTGYRIRRESTVQIVGLSDGEYDITAPATDDASRWDGWGTALKPAHEPIVVARRPLAGTVARNVLEYGTGALNVDGCRVDPGTPVPGGGGLKGGAATRHEGWRRESHLTGEATSPHDAPRWPPNVLLDSVAAEELDRQSGTLTSGANPARRGSDKFRDAYGEFAGQEECTVHRSADAGGASRFFPVFRYEAKAAASERPRLKDGTAWATVKPVDLMAWLVRLVTPPGGTVLDPFAGSGTTAEGCIVEGFRCVLVEKDPVAAELIKTRLRKPIQPAMFGLDDGVVA